MPRFVVLEHTWNGTHWDFFLEEGSSLRGWALDAEPALGRVQRAREQPPHRRIYLEYEGPISGERGSVRRVDGGTYVARAWSAERVEVDLAGSVYRGTVELWRVGAGAAGGSSASSGWWFRLGKTV